MFLIESCPTKILLPNEEANKGGTEHHLGPKDLYTVMGTERAQIHILETAMKKRHYYYVSPEGRRLFDLGIGPIALSFVAVSDKATLAHLSELKTTKGDQWPYEWLKERRIDYESLIVLIIACTIAISSVAFSEACAAQWATELTSCQQMTPGSSNWPIKANSFKMK